MALADRKSVLTAGDIARGGIHSQQLTRMVQSGVLERLARGQYRLVNSPISENHGLVMASRAVPRGVICLLSALSFHGIGTQLPADIWIAIPRGTRTPTIDQPPLHIVHFSAAAFTAGIQHHRLEGITVPVYSVAKTLADLFKFRNQIGIDVAIEALREAWRDRRFRMDALDDAAIACRVERVMRPYIEAIVS
jgi:predicted transcriptional regulator of viral defense system